ncbi:TetR family transcriptional regulator [Streptomyces sp. NPDC047072]|uniref:acyl-CoA-like ligand-binding transcription factor n=1 Tax=Streptomyces sp. NPDC047072 TaxID=3154809 RepID=UPI0033D67B14
MSPRTSEIKPPPVGLRERKKARTRATIQSHALRLFREQGYDATRIEQIIDAAEVSETTFFRYFPTKEALVLSDDYDPELVAAYRAQPAEVPPIQALRSAFREVFGSLDAQQRAEQRERIALIQAVPALRASMLGQFAEAMNLLGDAVAERTGRRPDDFAVRTLAGALVGVMMAVLAAMADDPQADVAPLVDRAIGQLESGLSL